MPDPSSSSSRPSARLRMVLIFFVLMPCLPGLIFLLAGFLTDPRRQPRDPSPTGQVGYAQAWARTRGLLLAGGAVLIIGTLGSAAVLWKIARPGLSSEQEPPETAEESLR